MTTVREYILDQAKSCVMRDRNLDYDEPEKNFQDIAAYWNIYLGNKLNVPIEPHDTAIMAALIKIARIQKSPTKEDHWTDLAGYAACGAECIVEGPSPSPYWYPGGVSVLREWPKDSGYDQWRPASDLYFEGRATLDDVKKENPELAKELENDD